MEKREEIIELDNVEDITDEELTDDELISTFSSEVLDAAKAYILSIKQYKLLSYDETKELFDEYIKTHDKNVKNKIVEHNLRLVVKLVGKVGKPNTSMEFLDLIQEGNIGLMKAVDRFNPALGYKFSTYATYWIKQSITRSQYNNDTTIRIPVGARALFYKYLKYKSNFLKNNGRYPNEEEIKEYLNIKNEQYKTLIHIENNVNTLSSLNELVSNDDDASTREELLADKKSVFDTNTVNKLNDLSLLYNLKSSLPKIYYYVLYYRVLTEDTLSLEEVGDRIGLTRERVRQIENKALEKAKLIRKQQRNLSRDIDEKSVLPEPFEKYAILAYLKRHLSPYEYYIFYYKWYKHSTIINDEFVYNDIIKEYSYLFRFGGEYSNAIKEVAGNRSVSIIFDEDISPINYSSIYSIIDKISEDEIKKIISGTYLEDEKLIHDFFDSKVDFVRSDDIELVLRKLNLNYYGYQYKKSTIPLDLLYKTYLENYDEFTPQVRELLEGSMFSKFTNKTLESQGSHSSERITYSIKRLEIMYYNLDNFLRCVVPKNDLERVLNDKKNDLSDYAREIIYKRYIQGISKRNLAIEYGIDDSKMRDELRKSYDHAITLLLNRSNRLVITDEERYSKYILDKRYPMTEVAREVCRLFIIEHKNYKEINEILNIGSTTKVSNYLTESIRRMDIWYYGIINANILDKDKVKRLLNERNFTTKTRKIIINKFIKCMSNEENALDLDLEVRDIENIVLYFSNIYNEYYSQITLTDDQIIHEINLPLCDSVLTLKEKEFLSFAYGLKTIYNEEGEKYSNTDLILKLHANPENLTLFKENALLKIREHVCGFISPSFSAYSQDEVRELLKNPLLPITDYEKELLRSVKGLDNVYYNQSELARKYGVNRGSITRRINRALLTLKKYESGLIESKVDYETVVKPMLKYFPLFDQEILIKRFKENKTCEQIGKPYKLTEQQSLDLVDRVERRLFYLLKYPNAKKFDFDYARSVIHEKLLPFNGNKDKAIMLYERIFGDDGLPPLSKEKLSTEFNLSKNLNLYLYAKYLMVAVLKYKDGIRKNNSFTKEEIEEYYKKNKDKYSLKEQMIFESTIDKLDLDNVELPYYDVYNEFVTYEVLKSRKTNLFYNALTKKEIIRDTIINNPYNISHFQLKTLRDYYEITKRELMNGKEKNKLIKLLSPVIMEYYMKKKKEEKESIAAEVNKARKVFETGEIVKEDTENNISNTLPYFYLPHNRESDKVLIGTNDLDYVFAYIFNHIKNIDVLSSSELLKNLYALKSLIVREHDHYLYTDIFKNGLTDKNLESITNLPKELRIFFKELIRLSNGIVRQDITLPDYEYKRKTFVQNTTYFKKIHPRLKNTNVNFIKDLNDYYQEINLGRIKEDESNLKESLKMYQSYLAENGKIISYFARQESELIDYLFDEIDHEVIDIRGTHLKDGVVGKLVRTIGK